jgi:UDP-N-acetylmuramoyl-tripeptide--D-alanyl-D-alanine ligase
MKQMKVDLMPALGTTDVWEGFGGLLVASHAPDRLAFERGSIDSREARPGDLFFALRGENVDAHEFVGAAASAGAAGVVVGRPVDAADAALFLVSDPLTALQELAASWRRKHDVKVIAITGSVGKTTAKEIIASVVSRKHQTLKTEANLNTEIGVPLTLLKLRDEHERAVLELGMYLPGDIGLLARITQPAIGVVTNVSPVHLERVRSFGRIVGGKAELIDALPPDGLAVLNGDDPRVTAMSRRTTARSVLFGQSDQCDVRATDIRSRGLAGFSFRLHHAGEFVEVKCGLAGRHHVYPALAAAAVALNDDMPLHEVAEALGDVRIELRLTVRPGANGSMIIDDSYNASPASMMAALDLLSETSGRRIALLGHMRELGAAERESHERVGAYASGACDLLFVVGEEARVMADAAKAARGNVEWLATAEEAAHRLRKELKPGDHCLVKASRAVGLESVVEALVAE